MHAAASIPARGPDPARQSPIPARYPERWIGAVVALAVTAYIVGAFALSPQIHWDQVSHFLTFPTIIRGMWLTIVLTVVSQLLGTVGGVLLAVMRLSENPVLNSISWFYIWLFRGTPVLIQIIFWFNLALVFPTLGIGIPFTDLGFSVPTNQVITAFTAAVLALGLNEAAYMAEIVRGGILSVDPGQGEAASSIGMTRRKAMARVILPQAVRTILPPWGNEFIGMLKSTSLVSVIATAELLTSAQQIYARNFFTIELLLVASFWYLVMTTIATVLQSMLEKRFEVSLKVRPETMARRLLNRATAGRRTRLVTLPRETGARP
ncbi:amino acid ABC transporter permease [Leucobacter sp. CSA1]|uniref:Amino acid ABC transporter permease n=1 Tax=Leucobacter chromiisoli TaxID=2796471 RepID=A0A934Q844_9MICO|nr:amino acid ABC transporter permease [Leucobacter chromiisoli]MBK0419561.1 amino acid ABC transporter permease [Leucobacter chromiisoli]